MMAVTVWLARWSRQSTEEQNRNHYVGILVILTASALAVSLLRSVLTFSSLVKVRNKDNKSALRTLAVRVFSILRPIHPRVKHSFDGGISHPARRRFCSDRLKGSSDPTVYFYTAHLV